MGKNVKTPISIRLSPGELELLDKAAKRYGGNKTMALVEGLKLANGLNEISKATIIAEIERRLR